MLSEIASALTDATEKEKKEYKIEDLMRTYGNDVLRTAYLYVKDFHIAEDIFQEVFLKADRNLSSFRGESSMKTWLIRITINSCKDFLKSAYHRHVVPLEDFQEDAIVSESDFEQVEKQETKKELHRAIMELPQTHRDVVLCIYFQDMTVPETAKTLGLAEGTVKSRLSRAKDKLKKILERR